MKKIITKSFLFLFLFATANCGFKVINESEKNNFSIQEIKTSGDKRINFKIKNNLQNSAKKNDENTLIINLITKKSKNIKEKNIKNEITKYQISLVSQLELFLIKGDTRTNFSKSVVGDYTASDSYSTTINNEKKIVEDLVENLSEKILDEISLRLNDL